MMNIFLINPLIVFIKIIGNKPSGIYNEKNEKTIINIIENKEKLNLDIIMKNENFNNKIKILNELKANNILSYSINSDLNNFVEKILKIKLNIYIEKIIRLNYYRNRYIGELKQKYCGFNNIKIFFAGDNSLILDNNNLNKTWLKLI